MRNFDVLLVPSLSEVQPMVILEALASGIPVVATSSSGFLRDLNDKLGFEKTEAKAESAGFSDTKMYTEYLRTYDEAAADFGKY